MNTLESLDRQSEDVIVAALLRLRLIGAGVRPTMKPLTGGVSSDIWQVDVDTGPVCIKRALARLKVAAVWEAPVERNAFEYAWFEVVGKRFPANVPRILARDADMGLFVMEYLAPDAHPVWKAELMAGRVDADFAAATGRLIADIHSMTADDPAIAHRFATDTSFHALRLEPYLLAAAEQHRPLETQLRALVATTAGTRRVLVHGDISPKNILCGPHGPVILDAECAWYGDPAFDLAFCLNHLLLKSVWRPLAAQRYLESYAALASAYLERVTWEPAEQLESRAARLLPGLFLARVDGKSPAEYLTDLDSKDCVRRIARQFIVSPTDRLATIAAALQAVVLKEDDAP